MITQIQSIIIEKKYKTSRFIDGILIFLFIFILFVISGLYFIDAIEYVVIASSILGFVYYFLGDKLFKNQSIGKKIMKIKINSTNGDEMPSLSMIIRRRRLEWKNYNRGLFSSRIYDIDKSTSTQIVFDHKSKASKETKN